MKIAVLVKGKFSSVQFRGHPIKNPKQNCKVLNQETSLFKKKKDTGVEWLMVSTEAPTTEVSLVIGEVNNKINTHN